MNSVKPESKIVFFATVTAGIPRLFNADADALGESILESRNMPETVEDCVRIGSEEAFIPNLELIQTLLESEWGSF